jgi:hypothetical protein
MRKTGFALMLVPLMLALLSGCQRLSYSKSITLRPTFVHEINFDPPTYAQKVTVTIAPVSAGVSAYLVKDDDKMAVERELNAEKTPSAARILGSRESKGAAETYTFEATVPPKTAYTLFLRASNKTDVKVTVTGR